jgi:hypothetical protein
MLLPQAARTEVFENHVIGYSPSQFVSLTNKIKKVLLTLQSVLPSFFVVEAKMHESVLAQVVRFEVDYSFDSPIIQSSHRLGSLDAHEGLLRISICRMITLRRMSLPFEESRQVLFGQ